LPNQEKGRKMRVKYYHERQGVEGEADRHLNGTGEPMTGVQEQQYKK
jgi:hypothetical protein